MKIERKILLWSFLITSSILPIVAITSCNIRTGREIKNNKLDNSTWKSDEWKVLEKMIQKKFKYLLITDMFTKYVFHNTNPKTSISKKWGLSEIANAKTEEMRNRIFLVKKKYVGNYGTDTLSRAFDMIRNNKLIPIKYKLLLNKISTIYNRTINMYPTKIYPKKIGKEQYMHIEFRADLLTSMKRRFVRKFLDLKIDFPIFDREYTSENLRKFYKITQLSNPISLAQEITTAAQMRNIWLSTIRTDNGIRPIGNGIIDLSNGQDLLGTQQMLNLNSGFYPLNAAKTDLYIPKFTGNIGNNAVPAKYIFANWHPLISNLGKLIRFANHEFITLNKADKVSKLEKAIKNNFFVNSKMPLFKALFGLNGNWEIMVQAQTWAGNPTSNYTIADWVENIGHRGNFFFYIIKKIDPSESYYYKISAGMSKVQEVS